MEALKQRPGKHVKIYLYDKVMEQVAVMLDTKGPEIRTGYLVDGKAVTIEKDSIVEITTDYTVRLFPTNSNSQIKGDSTHLACTYKDLPTSVSEGQLIYVSDGDLTFQVVEIGDIWIRCRAMNTATIGETKNMNIPGAIITLPTLTESVFLNL